MQSSGVYSEGLTSLEVETAFLEEWREFALDLIESLLGPLNAWLVHLIDQHDQLLNAERLGQHGVLLSLATAVETGLEFTLTSRNNENTNVSLRSAADHIGHIVLVTRGIEESVSLLGRSEVSSADFDCFTLVSLFLVRVHDISEIPRLTILLFGLFLILRDSSLVDLTSLKTKKQIKAEETDERSEFV